MNMRFVKMHGLGNDYLFVDAFQESVADPAALSRLVSDRHRGLGSDGLILVMPPGHDRPGPDADVQRRWLRR